MRRRLVSLFFILLTLPVVLGGLRLAVNFLTNATGQKADLIVNFQTPGPIINPFWQALAQGGEELDPFTSLESQIRQLKPQYIRLDHVYDFYHVVRQENNQLVFDWQNLDRLVDSVLKTGALPFFSLSYLPPELTSDGQVTSPPRNWSDWSLIVQKTIEHYSGRRERNLANVIYEVWNEPDLFGQWKVNQPPNYLTLYDYAARGAKATQNVNPFKIGGPATTAPYATWTNELLEYCQKNQLRLDFISYHRYSLDPAVFVQDADQLDLWLAGKGVPRFLTEWGSDSENSPRHDTTFDAAHLVAIVRQLLNRVELAFIFEIKDGPSPEGKTLWGRWGLITHQKYGAMQTKPKYHALDLLNNMRGQRLSLTGEGDWVTGFATRDGNVLKIMLVNYDPQARHAETFPLTITNLPNGDYVIEATYLNTPVTKESITVINQPLVQMLTLSPNNLVLLKITPSGQTQPSP